MPDNGMVNVQFFPCGHFCQFRRECVEEVHGRLDAPTMNSVECPECIAQKAESRNHLARYGLTEADLYMDM